MAPRMLAIYGKGGMGKSFFTSNLTARLTFDGHRVLQLGCDPKHDSCNTVFGGHSLPTLGDVWRRFKDAGKEDELRIPDVIFRSQLRQDSVLYGCELGGPDVGRGCGGQGISSGFKNARRLGHEQVGSRFCGDGFPGRCGLRRFCNAPSPLAGRTGDHHCWARPPELVRRQQHCPRRALLPLDGWNNQRAWPGGQPR